MKKIIFLLTLFTVHGSLITQVNAQVSSGLTAIPPRLEITGQPGETITKEIKVRNESQVERTVTVDTKDFIVSDAIGTPIQIDDIDESANRWAASTWIQVSPSKMTLKPGETKSLSATIIIPNKATAGGHYAMVLHTPNLGSISIDGSGAAVQTRVGTLVYITVPGDITENAQVKEFSAPKFLEYGPVDFRTVITNLSDIHILPIGNITIKNLFGLKSGEIELPETRIFPLTDRIINTTFNKKWLLGPFTAKLAAGYGTQGQALVATTTFWVIPWRLLVLIAAAIVILFVLIKLIEQKSREEIIESTGKVDELERELQALKKKYSDKR